MTEKEVMEWMRLKVKKDGFNNAADLARQFLNEKDIDSACHPDFQVAFDAGFKIAEEAIGPFPK